MVEIIPKKASPLPRWPNILFYFSLVLLVFCIVSYFIFGNSLQKSQKSLTDWEDALVKGRTSERISLEQEILKYQKKTEDFSKIIGEHLKTSGVFEILQRNCHPKTWFSQFNLDARNGTINIAGGTQSFETLGQQILIFKGEDAIKNVNLGTISINKEGTIGFTISLLLKPQILKFLNE